MSLVLEGTLGDPPRTYGVRDGLLVCGTCEVAAASAEGGGPSAGYPDAAAFGAHACPEDAPAVQMSMAAAGETAGLSLLGGAGGESGELSGAGASETGESAGETGEAGAGETADPTPTRITTRKRASTT
jgi:hypothetical protein